MAVDNVTKLSAVVLVEVLVVVIGFRVVVVVVVGVVAVLPINEKHTTKSFKDETKMKA